MNGYVVAGLWGAYECMYVCAPKTSFVWYASCITFMMNYSRTEWYASTQMCRQKLWSLYFIRWYTTRSSFSFHTSSRVVVVVCNIIFVVFTTDSNVFRSYFNNDFKTKCFDTDFTISTNLTVCSSCSKKRVKSSYFVIYWPFISTVMRFIYIRSYRSQHQLKSNYWCAF